MDMSTNVLGRAIELRRALTRAAPAAFSGELTLRQGAVLRELRDASATQVSLARAIAVDPSFMVRMIDDLQERGLVRRKRSETDRREVIVSLTAAGGKALGPLDVAYGRLAQALQRELTAEERAAFLRITEKMCRSLDALVAREPAPVEVRRGQR